MFRGLLFVRSFSSGVAAVFHHGNALRLLRRRRFQFVLMLTFELTLHLQLAFSLDDRPWFSLGPESRARCGQCDPPQALRPATSISHRGQVIEERLVLGFLFVFELELMH
jgi:hypothetical protein